MRSSWGTRLAIVPWSVFVGAGFFFVLLYENTPAPSTLSQRAWPANTEIAFHPGHFNLVMAIHPCCPCTRATLDELNRIIAERPGSMVVHVLIYRPSNSAPGWEQTDHWRRVQSLPGVHVRTDDDAVEATRFGTLTSGHVLLFDPKGILRFSGGITNARGHASESIGRRAILRLLTSEDASNAETPVFGCSLIGSCAVSGATWLE